MCMNKRADVKKKAAGLKLLVAYRLKGRWEELGRGVLKG